jgi:cytochrome c-type biogenesis protein CcmH
MAAPELGRLKAQLAQLDGLLADGVLTGETARTARARLEAQIVALVVGQPVPDDSSAGPAPIEPAASAASAARLPRRAVWALGAFVLLFAAGGYAWLGNTKAWSVAPGEPGAATATATADATNGHPTDDAQIAAMVDRLAERLKTNPGDAEGWSMLGRSYTSQGRFPDALAAYKHAFELKPKDAQAMVDYADGLAVVNNRSLEGEPEKLILKALEIDPSNGKALALAGTIAFNKADFKAAMGHWERAIQVSDPSSSFAQQLQGALNDARQKAGLPPVAAASPAAGGNIFAAPADAAPAAAGGGTGSGSGSAEASISGRVSLKAGLEGKVGPEDTVFIFARAPTGSRMPLAILRKQVRDLPIEFKLDDSLAMSPAARLSTAAQVVVGARISKTGNAMPAPGDWQVLSEPMAVGAQGVRLEINAPVP